MATRNGRKALLGVRKSRSVGRRPKHNKMSTEKRRLIRIGKLIPKKDYLLGKQSSKK